MIKILGIILAVFILGGVGWYYFSSQRLYEVPDDSTSQYPTSQQVSDNSPDDGVGETGNENATTKHGSYGQYSPQQLTLAEGGTILLFFHAPWCPVCRAIEAEIQKNPAQIPYATHILKVDFDSAVDLRQKYGVTYQHTFVEVDQNGTAKQIFSDAYDLKSVLRRVE